MLNDDQAQKLKMLLASSGWNDVVKPVLARRGHEAIKALVLNPEERTGDFKGVDDSVLRAQVKECEFVLNVWNNELVAYDHNRRLEELETANNGANP